MKILGFRIVNIVSAHHDVIATELTTISVVADTYLILRSPDKPSRFLEIKLCHIGDCLVSLVKIVLARTRILKPLNTWTGGRHKTRYTEKRKSMSSIETQLNCVRSEACGEVRGKSQRKRSHLKSARSSPGPRVAIGREPGGEGMSSFTNRCVVFGEHFIYVERR